MQTKYNAGAAERQRLALGTATFAIEAATYMRDALQGRKMPPPTPREIEAIRSACKEARPVSRREAADFAAAMQTTLVVLTPGGMRTRAGIWLTEEGEWAGGLYPTEPEIDTDDDASLERGAVVALAGAAVAPNPRVNIGPILQAIEIARVLDPHNPISVFERLSGVAFQIAERFAGEIKAISDLLNGHEDMRVVEPKTLGILANVCGAGEPGGRPSPRGKAWAHARTVFAKEILW